MANIYISYNSRDREYAIELATRLRAAGHDVSVDIDTLSVGVDWRKTLGQALRRADVFVALMTENSRESQFVNSEIGGALAYADSGLPILVLPIVIGTLPIPTLVQHINVLRLPHFDADAIVVQVQKAIDAYSVRRVAEEKKASELQTRIETNAADYIDEAMKRLGEGEKRGRRAGWFWYLLGYASLVAGVVFSGLSLTSVDPAIDKSHWIVPSLVGLKCIVIVGLLIASSKYCFMLGRAHMSEALKNSDRGHAISFGKFYLRVFGANVEWNQLKEVFQHWNIDRGSGFSSLAAEDYDPKFVQAIKELTEAVASLKDGKKKEG